MNWTRYFINIAKVVSDKSKDQSTKVGCVIVDSDHNIVATGFNGFPRGIDDENPKYHERPLKYKITEHAERNAIYQAAARGAATRGSTLVLGHNPINGICSDCARAIIQARIVAVVGPAEQFGGKGEEWERDVRVGTHLLNEAGVHVSYAP